MGWRVWARAMYRPGALKEIKEEIIKYKIHILASQENMMALLRNFMSKISNGITTLQACKEFGEWFL